MCGAKDLFLMHLPAEESSSRDKGEIFVPSNEKAGPNGTGFL
jgi:hypothetical protein